MSELRKPVSFKLNEQTIFLDLYQVVAIRVHTNTLQFYMKGGTSVCVDGNKASDTERVEKLGATFVSACKALGDERHNDS